MLSAPWIAEFWRELNELERMLTQHDVDIKRLWQHRAWGHGWPVGGFNPAGGGGSTTTTTTTTTTTSSTSSTTTTTSTTPECGCCPPIITLDAGSWTNKPFVTCCPPIGGVHTLSGGCGGVTGCQWNEITSPGGCCVGVSDGWVVNSNRYIKYVTAYYCNATGYGYWHGYHTGDSPCDAGSVTLDLHPDASSMACNLPATITVNFS